MKLDPVFVRYLLRFNDKHPPQEVRRRANKFDQLMGDHDMGNDDIRAFGAILVTSGELEEGDVPRFIVDVLAELENNVNEFCTGYGINHAFAGVIKKLNCAEQAFTVMAKVASREKTNLKVLFSCLLHELVSLGVSLPTDEQWAKLMPKPKKGGRSKKK